MGGLSFGPDDTAYKAEPHHFTNQVLTFRAGRLLPNVSSPPEGFTRFAETPDFGELSWPDRDPMAALNTMLAEDGAVLTVPPGHDMGVVYLSHSGIGGTSAHPRNMIRLEAGSRLTLIDMSFGWGSYLYNPVTEIHVADGAVLTHVKVQNDGMEFVPYGDDLCCRRRRRNV